MTPPPRRAGGTARAAPPLRPAAGDRRTTQTLSLAPVDNRALANLCGPLDANLRQIEAALDVAIARRGADFTVTGASAQAAQGVRALGRFYAEAAKPLSVDDIQLGLVEIAALEPHGEHDALHRVALERVDRAGNGEVRLAGARGSDAEAQVVRLDCFQIRDLVRRAPVQVGASRAQHRPAFLRRLERRLGGHGAVE